MKLGLVVEEKMAPGLAFGLLNVRFSKPPQAFRSWYAARHCIETYRFESVLDVGAGALEQAAYFAEEGKDVTTIDFGSSIYAQQEVNVSGKSITREYGDAGVYQFSPAKTFDLVWMSHILEHQHDPGAFLRNYLEQSEGSLFVITLPVMHARLWPGHLTLWSPALALYFIASLGYDMSDAEVIHGANEFSIIFRCVAAINSPELSYDVGDIHKLRLLLPAWVKENGKSWGKM